MPHRSFKDRLFTEFTRIAKAVANPHRLAFLELLAQREWSVEELAQETGVAVANASAHLKVLRHAQLVEARRAGHFVYYRLADAQVFQLWQVIRQLGEARLAEVDRIVEHFVGSRDGFEAVDAQALLQRLHDERVVVLDVRPRAEYATGHLPGAYSIPIDELETRLGELSPDHEIIAYCRGPYCLFADDAVALLRSHGYQARRLAEGVPDWQLAGFPVEREDGSR